MRDVVLAPGLWMPAAAMAPLAARLRRAGYSTHVFAYRGRDPLARNVERFAAYAQAALGGRPAHFIGHSLGGVLVLEMLNAHPDIAVASALLLGSPVRGCLAGRRLSAAGIGEWMMGDSRPLWIEHESRWRRNAPLGVVAGTRALGLGRLLGGLPGANDGVVRVEETLVEGESARAHVSCGHSLLIFSPSVGALAEKFLRTGRFA